MSVSFVDARKTGGNAGTQAAHPSRIRAPVAWSALPGNNLNDPAVDLQDVQVYHESDYCRSLFVLHFFINRHQRRIL